MWFNFFYFNFFTGTVFGELFLAEVRSTDLSISVYIWLVLKNELRQIKTIEISLVRLAVVLCTAAGGV